MATLLTSSTTLLARSSLTTETIFAINWLSSAVFSAFSTAFSVRVSICSLLFSDNILSLVVSFCDIPEIISSERFVSVWVLFTSFIIFEAV